MRFRFLHSQHDIDSDSGSSSYKLCFSQSTYAPNVRNEIQLLVPMPCCVTENLAASPSLNIISIPLCKSDSFLASGSISSVPLGAPIVVAIDAIRVAVWFNAGILSTICVFTSFNCLSISDTLSGESSTRDVALPKYDFLSLISSTTSRCASI